MPGIVRTASCTQHPTGDLRACITPGSTAAAAAQRSPGGWRPARTDSEARAAARSATDTQVVKNPYAPPTRSGPRKEPGEALRSDRMGQAGEQHPYPVAGSRREGRVAGSETAEGTRARCPASGPHRVCISEQTAVRSVPAGQPHECPVGTGRLRRSLRSMRHVVDGLSAGASASLSTPTGGRPVVARSTGGGQGHHRRRALPAVRPARLSGLPAELGHRLGMVAARSLGHRVSRNRPRDPGVRSRPARGRPARDRKP